jgi:hypothetical protein
MTTTNDSKDNADDGNTNNNAMLQLATREGGSSEQELVAVRGIMLRD